MTPPTPAQDDNYSYFLLEAEDLLKTIEQDLLSLRDNRTVVTIHNLMRASHTLKGAATSVGLETMKEIAHVLEDVFKSLYNPDVEIDAELESLLFQSYECLRLCLHEVQLPLDLQQSKTSISQHSEDILNRVATIISQLQIKLGDFFNQEAPIPSSAELGFDVTQSIFEMGVKNRLESIAAVLHNSSTPDAIAAELKTHAEVFLGLSESLNLPGWGAIASATLAALDTHPDQVRTVATLALADFQRGHAGVLAGDRIEGGTPSQALQQLAIADDHVPIIIDSDGAIVDEDILQPETSKQSLMAFPALDASPAPDNSPNPDLETLLREIESVSYPDNSPDLDLETLFGAVEPVSQFSLDTPSAEVAWLADENLDDEGLDADPTSTTPTSQTPTATSTSTPQNPTSAPAPQELPPPPQPAPYTPSPTVRVEVEQLERLNYLSGELLINQNKQTADVDQINSALQQISRYVSQHQQTMDTLQTWLDRLRLRHAAEQGLESAVLATSVSNTAPNSNSANRQYASLSPKRLLSNTLLPFDSLEMDSYSDADVLLQSALEETAQIEQRLEQLERLARQASLALEKQQRLMTHVRDDLTAARMQPLGSILNRLLPVLSQLIATHHKPVQLTMTGLDVLVDKAIAERLYDPLLHLLRNAFDHGIEPPAVRQATGKSESGQIAIRAYRQGNCILIEVQDDGQGLDFDRIQQQAIELNLLRPEHVATLPNAKLTDFLFEPGFTTAKALSDLSGRGIGLNSVRTQLQALGGSVAIKSQPSQGTLFCLQIPITLTITKLMLCQAGGTTYALLTDAIEQILIPKPNEIHQFNGQRILYYSKEQAELTVPIRTLSDLLVYSSNFAIANAKKQSAPPIQPTGFPAAIGTPPLLNQPARPVLLINVGATLLGLEIDQIMGEQELVVRPLGSAVVPPSYVCGSSLLSNRKMALVIDVAVLATQGIKPEPSGSKLLSSELSDSKLSSSELSGSELSGSNDIKTKPITTPPTPSPALLSPSPVLPVLPVPKVLVVDDSVTIRQTLTKTLQAAGYQVVSVVDGIDALNQLQQQPESWFSIICDIEMPRMNGFELLNQCRQTPNLSDIPIVILTSRTSAKHRQIAQELGASFYMTKPYSDRELLANLFTLAQHTN